MKDVVVFAFGQLVSLQLTKLLITPNPGDYRQQNLITMSIKQFVFGATMLVATSISAQEKASVTPSLEQKSQEIQLLEVAGQLVNYGRQTKSALPLIQAVQIFQKLNVTDEADNTKQVNPFSETQLLADATKFADGDKNLLALIKEAGKATRGGATEAPKRYYRVIEAGETIYQELYLEDGQYIQIVVDGQGEGVSSRDNNGNKLLSDLRLTVSDKKGRVIAEDKSRGENCFVAFISRTSNITVAVKNEGSLPDTYVLYVYKTKMNY